MFRKKLFFLIVFLEIIAFPAVGANTELSKIQSQIKQTEQKNKQIEQQLKTSARDVETTKKQLVKTADKVSDLEEQRNALTRRIAELDKQRDKINAELSQNHNDIANATAGMVFIAAHPNFDAESMHDYVLTSAILAAATDQFDSQIMDATQKLKKEQKDIQNKLKKLSAAAKNISELSAGVGSSQMSSDAKFSKRKLNVPVRGKLVVRYGEKTALGLKSDGWRIRAHGNAIVMAPADGVVKFADSFRGFGKVIIMSHKNGYNTVMTNMGEIDALVGQEVLAGEPIGRMNENKPEMYLEVRRGKNSVDPARLFNEP